MPVDNFDKFKAVICTTYFYGLFLLAYSPLDVAVISKEAVECLHSSWGLQVSEHDGGV